MSTIDFLVLAPHGTGIHAFHTYANMLPGIRLPFARRQRGAGGGISPGAWSQT